MNKNYALLWLASLFTFSFINAQSCPETLGNQSTNDLIHFKIDPGSCSEYPSFITVEGSTFDKMSCNGTNLKYELSSGSPLTYAETFSASIGTSTCDYLDGVLRQETLSVEQYSDALYSLKVFPNPLTEADVINLQFNKNITASINMYDLTGKVVLSDELVNRTAKQINVSSLNNGIYMLQIVAENSSTTRKIVVMK
ncbi:MAG: T9SS type A sorting domain-containing protein [Flavobacteriaceae bacterium]|nr:T9SS type A sorting domain-containing protein [Flavobacteriaceae bacterium]